MEPLLQAYASAVRPAPPLSAANAAPAAGRRPPLRARALLLAVVGGRLAEGINFGDELGRCIVMVGLPYPSPSDPELVERLRFLDRAAGQGASRDHYNDLCMRAVNQSIGRAIRHTRDYAAVLLLDTRWVVTGRLLCRV